MEQLHFESITLYTLHYCQRHVYKNRNFFFLSQTKIHIEFPFRVLWRVHFAHSFFYLPSLSSSSSSPFHFIWSDEKKLVWKITKTSQCDVISNITDLVTHILISIDANCRNIITINIHFIGYYFKACINQREIKKRRRTPHWKKPSDSTKFSMNAKSSFRWEHFTFSEYVNDACACAVCALYMASDCSFFFVLFGSSEWQR